MTTQRMLVPVALCLLMGVPGSAEAQYAFTPIDVPGSTRTAANGNSPNAIAGEFDDAAGNTHGFVLSKGVFTPIDVPGSTFTSVNGINASGELAGIYDDEDGRPEPELEQREHGRRDEREDGRQSGVGQEGSDRTRQERQHQALGQQLPDDPAAPCTQRGPYRHLALPRARAREEEIGHVGARDHEHKADQGHQQEQRLAELAPEGARPRRARA